MLQSSAQVARTELYFNALMCHLCGVAEEEIAIVEGREVCDK